MRYYALFIALLDVTLAHATASHRFLKGNIIAHGLAHAGFSEPSPDLYDLRMGASLKRGVREFSIRSYWIKQRGGSRNFVPGFEAKGRIDTQTGKVLKLTLPRASTRGAL